jgi:putative Holliday junction resolvase
MSTSPHGAGEGAPASERPTTASAAEERRGGIRALGIDPGSKRIGVAVSDLSGSIASPLVVIQRSRSKQHDLAEIARLAREEEADVIVYGLPLNMDGSMSKAAKAATFEAKQLATLVDVPVEMHDERLTTVSADRSMLDAGMNAQRRRQVVDKVAAAIMLQSWLDARSIRLEREARGAP